MAQSERGGVFAHALGWQVAIHPTRQTRSDCLLAAMRRQNRRFFEHRALLMTSVEGAVSG